MAPRSTMSSIATVFVVGTVAATLTVPSRAQPPQDTKAKQPSAKPAKPPAAKPGPGATVMSEEPHHLDSAGLTFFTPEKSTVKSAAAGGEPTYQILADDNTWWIDVRTPGTSNPDLSLKDAGDAALEQLLARVGEQDQGTKTIKTVAKVLEKTETLQFPSHPELPGYRFYVLMPQAGKNVSVVRGYTLFKVSASRFAAFELTTPEPEFTRVRGIYETTVGAATFEDITAAMTQRALAVKAGLSLFEGLNPENLRLAIASRDNRWERLYVPNKTGADGDAQEIAYRRVRARAGQRGELDPSRPKNRWGAADRQSGYILQVDARFLDWDAGYSHVKRTVDMQSTFFMSEDRTEEAWTIRQGVREGDKAATTSETGARQGKSMTVRTEIPGQSPQTVSPKFDSDAYVSQIESYLLPQLMIGAKLPAQYAFYVFQSRDGKVKLRSDNLEQPNDRPGLWRLTTTFADDPQKSKQVSLYNDAGELIRTELADGKVWEPTDYERLVRLWRSKDLPLK